MGDEAALGEASGDQEVPQLGLGLPGDPQDGHVQPLAVAVAHLLLLSCLSGILPPLKKGQFKSPFLVQSEQLTVNIKLKPEKPQEQQYGRNAWFRKIQSGDR